MASSLVTTCFVSWSPITAAATTASRPTHCIGPAPSDRSATDTGASAFVEEPTRTSGRCGGASGCGSVTATPYSRLPAVDQPLVVDAQERPRSRAQPFLADLLAAPLAHAVAAVVELRDGALDLRQRLLRALLEPLVQLALEGDGGHVAEMVVDPAVQLAQLVVHALRVVLLEMRDLADDPLALLLERLTKGLCVYGTHARPSCSTFTRRVSPLSPRRPRAAVRPPPARSL